MNPINYSHACYKSTSLPNWGPTLYHQAQCGGSRHSNWRTNPSGNEEVPPKMLQSPNLTHISPILPHFCRFLWLSHGYFTNVIHISPIFSPQELANTPGRRVERTERKPMLMPFLDGPWIRTKKKEPPVDMAIEIQDGAPKIAKLVYKWLNNGLW